MYMYMYMYVQLAHTLTTFLCKRCIQITCIHNQLSLIGDYFLTFKWHLNWIEDEVEKYMNGTWQKIPPEDHAKMSKLDGQVWLSLCNLLLKEDCQRKYDFNNFNKNTILKVSWFHDC